MGEYTDKVAARLARALETGEHALAATPGAPRGAMRSIAFGDGPRSRRSHTGEGRAELEAFGVPYAPQFVVVLTDRRLLWARTTMTGRARAVIAAIARGDIDDIGLGEGRVLGQHYGELRFTHRDGRRCTLEVARPYVPRASELVACFHGVAAG